ncbi:MAG: GntR family transcriptional regulator [Beijerinckiaceae bacterium]|jgi:DNA-binding GntR family transcriptional regulator|nr:GntR family transcriptional regulator [Beijerinckiaceae bacterium]
MSAASAKIVSTLDAPAQPGTDDRDRPDAVASNTLAERVLQDVLDRIASGAFQPGSVINEVDLARRLAVSRGPVREAMRRLEGRKLIARSPFTKARVVSLGPAEIREIFEMREGLEGMATRLACAHMSDDSLRALVGAVESAGQAPNVFDLHRHIAENCGNRRIRDLLCDELYYLLRMYRRQSGDSPGRRAEASEEHWQIASAMQQRNGPLAESLMRAHIRRATEHLAAIDAASSP